MSQTQEAQAADMAAVNPSEDEYLLSTLTPEEREALALDIGDEGDGEVSDADRQVLAEIAGEDDATGAAAPAAEGETEPAASGTQADGVAAESADADAGAGDTPGGFRPRYEAAIPAELEKMSNAITAYEADVVAKFRGGEIEVEDFVLETKKIAAERARLERAVTKAEISREMDEQSAAQEWKWTVDKFFGETKRADGIDYASNDSMARDLDSFVKVLAGDPANADKDMAWFLAEAHRRTKLLHGIAPAEKNPDAKAEARPDGKPDARKPALDKLPKTLAGVPGGDGAGDVGDEFADIDRLDGMEYEAALKKMSPAQRERYLAAA